MNNRISKKQSKANRGNAKRSTGPNTPAGKEKVKWNALKHGLLSNSVIEGFGESKEEQEELLVRLIDDLAAVGELEIMLVDKIASCHLRLRRAMRGEVGTISRDLSNLDDGEEEGLESLPYPPPHELAIFPSHALEPQYKKEIRGVRTILLLLQQAEAEIEENRVVTESTQNHLYHVFGKERTSLAAIIDSRCATITDRDKLQKEDSLEYKDLRDYETCRLEMMEHINKESEDCRLLMPDLEEKIRREYDFKREIVNVPVSNDSVKAQRYEAMIDKEFYQAIDRLEKLQKRRLANENKERD